MLIPKRIIIQISERRFQIAEFSARATRGGNYFEYHYRAVTKPLTYSDATRQLPVGQRLVELDDESTWSED